MPSQLPCSMLRTQLKHSFCLRNRIDDRSDMQHRRKEVVRHQQSLLAVVSNLKQDLCKSLRRYSVAACLHRLEPLTAVDGRRHLSLRCHAQRNS